MHDSLCFENYVLGVIIRVFLVLALIAIVNCQFVALQLHLNITESMEIVSRMVYASGANLRQTLRLKFYINRSYNGDLLAFELTYLYLC
jgi:hypothetical protein